MRGAASLSRLNYQGGEKGICVETVEVASEGASAPAKLRFVLPGDAIELSGLKAGPGTYEEGGKAFASLLGLALAHKGVLTVVPLSGVYSARQGDVVIGNVLDLGPSNWTVDIRGSQPTSMHVNDVPWKVDFGDTARYIDVGEAVLCKVFKVDEVRRVFLTLSGPGLRKLEGGQVIEVAHTKIAHILGRRGERLEKIKKWTNCRIFAAANGRVWVDGDLNDMGVAVGAVRLIEREANAPGLKAALDLYLKEHGREPAPEAQAATGFGTADEAKAQAGAAVEEDQEETKRRESAAKEEE